MNTTMIETRKSPGCLLQILWFAFVGIWLGQAWIILAWLLMLSVIGIPLGVMMLNALPKVIALREPNERVRVTIRPDGSMVRAYPEQTPFLLRAVYFLLVGWWLSAVWMEVAYAISLTFIGLPLGFWMFDRVPAIVSLKRE